MKKKKIKISEFGEYLLSINLGHMRQFIDGIKKDKNSQFNSVENNILYLELVILSLWSLNFLNCGKKILNAVLNSFFDKMKLKTDDKNEFLNYLELRSKEYFDLWPDNSDALSLFSFASVICKNLDVNLVLNVFSIMEISDYFVSLTKINSNIISNAKKNINLVI